MKGSSKRAVALDGSPNDPKQHNTTPHSNPHHTTQAVLHNWTFRCEEPPHHYMQEDHVIKHALSNDSKAGRFLANELKCARTLGPVHVLQELKYKCGVLRDSVCLNVCVVNLCSLDCRVITGYLGHQSSRVIKKRCNASLLMPSVTQK